MRLFVFIVPLLLFSSFTMKKEIPVIDFSGLEPLLSQRNDTTFVVNFWATWCLPCVKELPAFEQIHEKFRDQKVKVLLVSLDFPGQLESRVIPFIQERQLKADVLLLNDPNSNVWIDKVDKSWTGAIPATVIFNRDYYGFFERSFDFAQLDELLNQIIIK